MSESIFKTSMGDGDWQKLSLPPFLKPEDFPIGSVLIAKVKRVIGNFTNDPEMDDCQNLWLETPTGGEILFPVTGTLGQSLLKLGNIRLAGKDIAIVRKEDSKDKTFKNKMFVFEVAINRSGLNDAEKALLESDNGVEIKRRVKKGLTE